MNFDCSGGPQVYLAACTLKGIDAAVDATGAVSGGKKRRVCDEDRVL